MSSPYLTSAEIQLRVERLNAGEPGARDELLAAACERLRRLTHHMLKGFPRVRRWEETDDVFQNAVVRLVRSMEAIVPKDAREFFRLAALNIRRELLDLAKHHYGPLGRGAKHASVAADGSDAVDPVAGAADETSDPAALATWTEFHAAVDKLPDDEREVFDLLWYQGLQQAEAAGLLGVSERTVKRWWQSARLHLYDALGGQLPEL